MIRAVGFDLDDTLATVDRPREHLLQEAADRAGLPVEVDREEYLAAHRAHSGAGSRQPVFEALVDDEAAAAALTASYREAIADSMALIAGAGELIADLRGTYRVGLLTDGPEETQRDKLRRIGLADAFDVVVITGAVGSAKPATEAFTTLAERLDVPAESVAYVGDDPERDVAGAATVGMQPVQVRYDGGPAPHPAAAATLRRTDLDELPGVLEGFRHPSNHA